MKIINIIFLKKWSLNNDNEWSFSEPLNKFGNDDKFINILITYIKFK
jgi:hypothetical protein